MRILSLVMSLFALVLMGSVLVTSRASLAQTNTPTPQQDDQDKGDDTPAGAPETGYGTMAK